MKKKKNLIKQYTTKYDNKEVTVNVLKFIDKKEVNNARNQSLTCPNCLSKLTLDQKNNLKCSGNHLNIWEEQFKKYHDLDQIKKDDFLKSISYDSMFMDLYDRWAYSINVNKPEEFNCGYTNKIFLPVPSCQVIIPDPIQVKIIENNIGRKLTEQEILGEKELYYNKGIITEDFIETSKKIKIRLLRFPEDC